MTESGEEGVRMLALELVLVVLVSIVGVSNVGVSNCWGDCVHRHWWLLSNDVLWWWGYSSCCWILLLVIRHSRFKNVIIIAEYLSSFQPVWVATLGHSCSKIFMVDTSPRNTNHHFFTEPSCEVLYFLLALRFWPRELIGMRRLIAFIITEGVADFIVPHTFLASSIGTRLLCESGEDEGWLWFSAYWCLLLFAVPFIGYFPLLAFAHPLLATTLQGNLQVSSLVFVFTRVVGCSFVLAAAVLCSPDMVAFSSRISAVSACTQPCSSSITFCCC